MRARSEGLTASGLLIARETDAVDTPARAATARIPCFTDPMAGGFIVKAYVTLHQWAKVFRSCLAILLDIEPIVHSLDKSKATLRVKTVSEKSMLPNRQAKAGSGRTSMNAR